jgi:hypothetical protein
VANPTTNYGFVLPTPTDLVTDLPADFDVALQGVDTRLKALQPGTTLGDIAYSSATANTNTRLGIGSTGQVLTVTGGVPVWATPSGGGGKVLQVVYGNTTTSTTNATSTYADTTLTATITPTLATSKVLVMVAQNGLEKGGANLNNAMGIKIFRGATEISASTPLMLYTGIAEEIIGTSYAQNILDTPATTSATTYKTQFRNANNGSGIIVQYDNARSTIILMEIGA